ncbi:hypothetical protein [Phaeobacter sp.]|uniref:hypothetical protein n=1 Tax=Phaeobacter sp. TaxID=1902409 RepID=UPI0025D46B9F|nr:hypothetical protein [Phaeobacter sp.]
MRDLISGVRAAALATGLVAVGLMGAMAGSAEAADGQAGGPRLYSCKVQSYEKHGWIAPEVLIFVDHGEKFVGVLDGIIYNTQKRAEFVEYDPRSKQRLKLKWTLNNVGSRSGSTKVSYTATLDERRMKVSLTARVHGYDNRPPGSGPCTVSNKRPKHFTK